MNFVKATAIVFVLAIGVALVVLSARAQTPSVAPTGNAPVGNIPEEIPPNFRANGWDQAGWTAMREHCRAVFSQAAAAQNMTPEELKKLTPFPHSDWQLCITLSSVFSGAANAAPGSSPAPAPSGAATATPMNTPLPPALPDGPQSLEPDTSGPLTTGQSFRTSSTAKTTAGLQAFVKAFPDLPITPKIKTRIARIHSGKSSFRFNCHG
jgi:hypothetical protein